MKKIYIFAIIIAIIIIAAIGFFAFSGQGSLRSDAKIVDVSALTEKGVLSLNGQSKDESNGIFTSSKSDENSVLVNKSSILKLTNSFINKTGNTASSGDAADFYGINSAVLVKDASQLTIENCEILTNSKGSNGIFATNTDIGQAAPGGAAPEGNGSQPPEKPPALQRNGQASNDTTANVKNVKITTHQDKSRGLDSTFGGIINAENVVINTDGNSSAALATDRGEGNVTVSNSFINTGCNNQSGRGSPLIYSTGNITAKSTKGTAFASQIACIEGKNSITLDTCKFTGYGEGNRKEGNRYVDLGGIFIYQSMSGDAGVGTSTFICKNSELNIAESSAYNKKAPMFFVTNTKANIYLEGNNFFYGSGLLFNISGQNQWGNNGTNGGHVNLTTQNQELYGKIHVDPISSLNFTLDKGSAYEGQIISNGTTNVVVNKDATWKLTANSYITSLNNTGNINLNGFKLYVNGTEYKG
ncbi:hypothetical protein [Methanobrevibacter sp.]|uniref:hypothetical protein n=1 Tax=Methanobrevibacter sp. TaxID=66852 RepID=UPI00388D2420